MLYYSMQEGVVLLEAIGARKRFGELTALHNLTLKVSPGEIVCLLGANGAGKSTTINLLLGFLEPDGGKILVSGEPLTSGSHARAGLA